MMFPAETLKLIQATAQQAHAAQRLDVPDPRRTHFVLQGERFEVPINPPLRKHVVYSLEDLIAYTLRAEGASRTDGSPEGAPRTGASPVLWYAQNGMRLILDDADRRDVVLFELEFSIPFKALQTLDREPVSMTQQQFLHLLRVQLGVDKFHVQKFRKLDWETIIRAKGEVDRGRDRLGKEIASQVSGVDDVPEELQVTVPVYRNPGEMEPHTVGCLIELNAANNTIQLVPKPGEVDLAVNAHLAGLRQRLEEGLAELEGDRQIPIYYGTP